MFGFAQLMMGKTDIVGASDQIHPGLKGSEATSGMARFARQAGQPFPQRAIQTEGNGRVEDRASLRALQQVLRLHQYPVSHLPRDVDHPLVLGVLEDCATVQVWPDLSAGSSHSRRPLLLLWERSAHAAGIRAPAVGQDQQGAQAGGTATNLLHQALGQAAISRYLDHSPQPQTGRNHHR
jgi:hypothetical protein